MRAYLSKTKRPRRTTTATGREFSISLIKFSSHDLVTACRIAVFDFAGALDSGKVISVGVRRWMVPGMQGTIARVTGE